jgi:hypothetical protein
MSTFKEYPEYQEDKEYIENLLKDIHNKCAEFSKEIQIRFPEIIKFLCLLLGE